MPLNGETPIAMPTADDRTGHLLEIQDDHNDERRRSQEGGRGCQVTHCDQCRLMVHHYTCVLEGDDREEHAYTRRDR